MTTSAAPQNHDGPLPASTSAPIKTSMNTEEKEKKPAVLIIGGLGYIGRFLALHIHNKALASEVRLVDKVLPQLAWLAPEFSESCSQDKFMQADASREQSLGRIFTPTSPSIKEYDYVFNCGGETRYSQDESVYRARSLDLSLTLAKECARRKIPSFIEFSTGMVYKPPGHSTIAQGGCTEDATIKPWLKLARYKAMAEEGLAKIDGLNYAVLRLAHVYGTYDVGFLARGLCLARVYQSKGEEMKWLYGKDLRINTVHVEDVCTAAWKAAEWCAANPARPVSSSTSSSFSARPSTNNASSSRIFNIADGGDTSQAALADLIHTHFSIPTGFQNTLISTFARFNLDSVVNDVNEDILQPWADLLHEKGITVSGPISPFMEKELLRDCDLCLNAARAREVLGWVPSRSKLDEKAIEEVVDSYTRMGWWP
ncbi:hypothetical protein MMC09_001494 [Bachmanniomyces sp. S44760]|nr:hypothetical protein [Bachmanniomyces sp. S44760]